MADYTNVVISGTTRRVNSGDNYTSTTVTGSGLLEMVAGNAYATTLTDNGRLWMQGGAYASGVAVGGGSCRISAFHAGTILEDFHIDSGANAAGTWRLDIRAGVTVSNAVVSGAAIQHTGANAVIRDLVMDQGAMMYTYNYASAYNVTVESANAAQLRLYNHGYIDNITIKKGNLQIFGQGFAENVHIYDKVQIWSSGTDGAGSANSVTVYKGGTLEVLTSAIASNVTVSGVMKVGSAAVVYGVSAYGDNTGGATASAYVQVSSGGKLVGGVVSGARVDVSSGCSAENIVVSGGYGMVVRQATVTNCSAVGATGNNYIFIQSSSILSGGYFADNGRLRLESGCSALDVVFENCAANTQFIIGAGAYTSNYILRGANTGIEMRGTALNGKVSGGTLNFTSSGTLTGLTVSNGGNFNFGTEGDITDVTVKAGGKLFGKFSWDYDFTLDTIANGSAVIAPNVIVASNAATGGHMIDIKADGVASGANASNGYIFVSSGGTFTDGAIDGTGGTLYAYVYNGGLLSNTSILTSARADVSSGGSAENVVVYGSQLVLRQASATNCSAIGTGPGNNYVQVQSDSILRGGYFANNGTFRGVSGSATDLVFENGGSGIAYDAFYTSKFVLRDSAVVDLSNGSAYDATLSGGTLNVKGGTVTGVDVIGGNLAVSAGAKAVDVIVRSGAPVADFNVGSGANLTVESGATVQIRNGGDVSSATIGGYAHLYTGVLSGVQILSAGTAKLEAAAALIENVHINSGGRNQVAYPNLDIRQGRASGVVASGAAIQVLNAAASISGAVLEENATMVVYNNAAAADITVESGLFRTWNNASVTGVTVNSGGQFLISSGANADTVDVTGGYVEVQTGATIDGMTIQNAESKVGDVRVYNGYVTNADVAGNAAQIVFRFSTASGSAITASDGAYLHVQNAAVASNVTVSGARLILGMAPSTTGNTGSVYDATLTSAQVDIVSGGILSGFAAEAGSMFISTGATIEDGTVTGDDAVVNILNGATANSVAVEGGSFRISAGATGNEITVGEDGAATVAGTLNVKTSAWNVAVANGGVVNVEAGESLGNVNTVAGARINVTKDGAGASLKGDRTNIAEGTLYYSGAQLAATAVNGVLTGLNAGTVYKLSIGDGILVNDVTLNNGEIRISCFDGASVDGATVSAGAIICNAGAYGTMDNVTLVGAGIMNLSGTAQANGTVVSNGGQFALNAATVKAENTTLKAGAKFNINAAGADTGDKLTLDVSDGTSISINNLGLVNSDTEIVLTGETAGNTYTIATTGSTERYVNCGEWGLYDDRIKSGETITNAFTGMSYAFSDGKTIAVTEFTAATQAAAGSIADGTTINGNGKAAKWTANTTATGTIKAATSGIAGDAWLELDGANLAGTTLFGAETGFGGAVNLYATNNAVVNNLAAGAEAGGTVGAVKLTVDDATVGLAYAGGFGNVTGATETLIADGTFAKDFYAGALANYAKTGATTQTGDVALTIEAGTFSGNIYGAASVKAGTATSVVHSVANVTINVTGGETTKGNQACLFAGGYATGSTTNKVYEVTSVSTTIDGGDWGTAAGGRGVFGGIFASNVTAEAGNVSVTINGGTFGNVYGGGWAQKGGNSIVGDVEITIDGGTIANVFGGGTHSTSGGTTTAGDVTITVSGGSITGDIFARGQSAGDSVTGDVCVTFTGDTNFRCGVYGYSYVGGEASDAVLNFTAYTGAFSGAIGGFDSIVIDDDTAMTLTTAAANVNNGKWEFDFTGRADTLAGTSLLTWENADFAGDTVRVNFTDEAQAQAGWSIADATFTGATFTLAIAGTDVTTVAYDTEISGGDYDGWKFTSVDGTLKFAKLA